MNTFVYFIAGNRETCLKLEEVIVLLVEFKLNLDKHQAAFTSQLVTAKKPSILL